MALKTTIFRITKAPTDASGKFEIVAYDRHAGDVDGRVFTLAEMQSAVRTFERRGRPLVLRWSHDMQDPDSALGIITRLWIDGGKLMAAGRFDLENPLSVRVYEGILTGRINEFSVGWIDNGDGTIDLLEISAAAAGANRGTGVACVGDSCKCAGACQTSRGVGLPAAREASPAAYAAKIAAAVGETTPRPETSGEYFARLAKAYPDAVAAVERERQADAAAQAEQKRIDEFDLRLPADHHERERFREEQERAAFERERARLEAEPPLRVAVSTTSTVAPAPDAPARVLDENGRLRSDDGARRLDILDRDAEAGDVVGRVPVLTRKEA